MAEEYLPWTDPPGVTDGFDGGTTYNLGTRFTLAEAASITGVRWRCPTTAPGVTPIVSLWNTDTQARLAFEAVTPASGVYVNTYFDAVYEAAAGDYIVSVFTDRYTATVTYPWPLSTPSGIATAGTENGRIVVTGADNDFPINVSGNSASYHVSPIIGVADVEPAEGAAALGLELALSATGGRASKGAAAAGLSLTVAAAGARDSKGAGAAGLQLALAAAGARPSRGSAAFTLNLGVAAAGPVTNAVPARRLTASARTAGLGASAPTSRLTAGGVHA